MTERDLYGTGKRRGPGASAGAVLMALIVAAAVLLMVNVGGGPLGSLAARHVTTTAAPGA